ncbi:MAG: hypothetical protein OEZ01_06625 [Candidatus Heimdallarchaeota archaeon]|nr:hypothetical protein [Candidatus Heimdallarchaeota archaeon]MDH5645663.1 hypothetical protein [Candidatus Heimdallarchaeota archaeon]
MRLSDFLLIVLAAILYTFGDYLLKVSNWISGFGLIYQHDLSGLLLISLLPIALGLAFLSKLIQAKIMANNPLGSVQSLNIGLVIIFSIIIGKFLLDEVISKIQLAGLILILIGIFLISKSEK